MSKEYINLFRIYTIVRIVKYIFIIEKQYIWNRIKFYMEGLIEKVSNVPVRDGHMAIPVYGPTLKNKCRSCQNEFELPTYIFNDDWKIKEKYRLGITLPNGIYVIGRELSNGAYISREDGRFCRLMCWSDFCQS